MGKFIGTPDHHTRDCNGIAFKYIDLCSYFLSIAKALIVIVCMYTEEAFLIQETIRNKVWECEEPFQGLKNLHTSNISFGARNVFQGARCREHLILMFLNVYCQYLPF